METNENKLVLHRKRSREEIGKNEDEELEIMILLASFVIMVASLILRDRDKLERNENEDTNEDEDLLILDSRDKSYQRTLWLRSLRHGPTCKDELRITPGAFFRLCNILQERGGLMATRNVTIREIVATFLQILAFGLKNRKTKNILGRSGETISRQFHTVLKAVLKIGHLYIRQDNPAILEGRDIERWRWFQNAIGALDGTFVELTVPAEDRGRYRNRKGTLSTNMLGVCNANLKFLYVLPGWEGFTSDARVLRDAISRHDGLKVYPDRYYLVDDGYTNGPGFLAPYRSTRYHLNLWRGNTPNNHKELFNLRHSSARNVIERTFGLLKKRWGILRTACFYNVKTQIRIINACCILHNFVREEMPNDPLLAKVDRELEKNTEIEDLLEEEEQITAVRVTHEWTTFRDNLALQMFEEYQNRRASITID